MIGAIAGDIIGSRFEGRPHKSTQFALDHPDCRFTDDTVLSVAVAQAILEDRDYGACLRYWARRYPHAGYGAAFYRWMQQPAPAPYGSWGNGSAMRVSPVGFAFDTVETVLEQAARSASATHNHPEGVKGAQATALAVFLARKGATRSAIRKDIAHRFGYDLDRRLADIRPTYGFDVSCQGSVPEAIIAFLAADSYEAAVRNAVSLGGDSDTMACIAGAIAEAGLGPLPASIRHLVARHLPDDLMAVVTAFEDRFGTDMV